MESLIAPSINLAILLGFLFVKLKAPLKSFVQTRHETLRDEVSRVRQSLKSAQEQYEEFSAKLKAIDVELSTIHERMRSDAEQLKGRLVSSARQSAGLILAEAKARAESAATECVARLRSELGERVIERARGLVQERLTGADRARIQREFSERVGSAS